MPSLNLILAAGLALAASLACGELHAQARGPPIDEWKTPVPVLTHEERLLRMDAWLRRLAGQYHYDGTMRMGMNVREFRGIMDCTGIGTGPGVQCVNATFMTARAELEDLSLAGASPMMILLGMDPVAAELRYLYGNARGLPEGAEGPLRSTDQGRFLLPCVNQPPTCRRVVRIKAADAEAPVEIVIQLWTNFFADLEPYADLQAVMRRVMELSPDDARRLSTGQRRR